MRVLNKAGPSTNPWGLLLGFPRTCLQHPLSAASWPSQPASFSLVLEQSWRHAYSWLWLFVWDPQYGRCCDSQNHKLTSQAVTTHSTPLPGVNKPPASASGTRPHLLLPCCHRWTPWVPHCSPFLGTLPSVITGTSKVPFHYYCHLTNLFLNPHDLYNLSWSETFSVETTFPE